MNYSDLDPEERIALVGTAKYLVLADGEGTEPEGMVMDQVAYALGGNSYREALEEVNQRFAGPQEFRAFLKGAGRPRSRKFVYKTLVTIASADVVSRREGNILHWVEQAWGICG